MFFLRSISNTFTDDKVVYFRPYLIYVFEAWEREIATFVKFDKCKEGKIIPPTRKREIATFLMFDIIIKY